MKIRTGITLFAIMAAATAAAYAEAPGAAIYKANKCEMCHGATGMAETGPGKAMKVKPVTDPDVRKLSREQMVAATRNGMGKMQPYKDKLTDAQIKDAVDYFRTFVK